MNKKKLMQKRLGIQGAIMLAIVAGFAGLMMLTGSLATSAEEKKTTADNALNQDRSQLESLKRQLDQSGAAQKRFVTLQLSRVSTDFAADSNTFKEWLRVAKDTYRFGNSFKLKLSAEKLSDKAELKNFNYNVTERDDMQIEMDAISDLHVFSFIDALLKQAPGIIRVTKFELSRKSDMTGDTYRQMVGGLTPENVNAIMEFIWIGVQPKQAPNIPTAPGAPSAPASAPAGMPGMPTAPQAAGGT